MLRLEGRRRLIADGAVESNPVIEDFDVFEDIQFGLNSCGERAAVDEFDFQRMSKALDHCMVIAVAAPAHAGDDACWRSAAIGFTSVLAAAIAVMDEVFSGRTISKGHVESRAHQRGPMVASIA